MDYELKCVVAICLIAKIAALSPEFSIIEETERLEQRARREEALRLPSLAAQEPLATPADGENRGMHFDRGLGDDVELQNGEPGTDSIRINENVNFDTCEHVLQQLGSSAKWRDIQKTLHWLDKVLASNKSIPRLCQRKKLQRKSKPRRKDSGSHTSKRKGGGRTFKRFPEDTGTPDNLTVNWTRYAINSRKPNIYSGRNKKWRKEHKHKHKSRRNRWKKEGKEKGTAKNKGKKFRYARKHSHKKGSGHDESESRSVILKPSSVLFGGRKVVPGRGDPRIENLNAPKCQIIEPASRGSLVKVDENCLNNPGSLGKGWKGKGSPPKEMGTPKQKKPWPHFVYHRVSSNFLHPETTGQNHRQSAYVAISVATSSKPDCPICNFNSVGSDPRITSSGGTSTLRALTQAQ